MLNPKMKNHPPFVLTRLSNMQRSQHAKLLRKNKDSPRCTQLHCLPEFVLRSAKTHKSCKNAMRRVTSVIVHGKLTKYCACHEKRISSLILVTHETLFTMRGATSVIVQTHQILRMPRKMNLMIDPCHT